MNTNTTPGQVNIGKAPARKRPRQSDGSTFAVDPEEDKETPSPPTLSASDASGSTASPPALPAPAAPTVSRSVAAEVPAPIFYQNTDWMNMVRYKEPEARNAAYSVASSYLAAEYARHQGKLEANHYQPWYNHLHLHIAYGEIRILARRQEMAVDMIYHQHPIKAINRKGGKESVELPGAGESGPAPLCLPDSSKVTKGSVPNIAYDLDPETSLAKEILTRSSSTRIPDFSRISLLIPVSSKVDLFDLMVKHKDNPLSMFLRVLESYPQGPMPIMTRTTIIENKPDLYQIEVFEDEPDWLSLRSSDHYRYSDARGQVREQARHALAENAQADVIPAVIAFGQYYTYIEIFRATALDRYRLDHWDDDDEDFELPETFRKLQVGVEATEKAWQKDGSTLVGILKDRFKTGDQFVRMYSSDGEALLKVIQSRARQLFPSCYSNNSNRKAFSPADYT